ncbi:SH3-domain binding protein 1 [Pelomyxa schiedti]|nr:SH3-domain binding protein 1 [Pelomyxa schiedti]
MSLGGDPSASTASISDSCGVATGDFPPLPNHTPPTACSGENADANSSHGRSRHSSSSTTPHHHKHKDEKSQDGSGGTTKPEKERSHSASSHHRGSSHKSSSSSKHSSHALAKDSDEEEEPPPPPPPPVSEMEPPPPDEQRTSGESHSPISISPSPDAAQSLQSSPPLQNSPTKDTPLPASSPPPSLSRSPTPTTLSATSLLHSTSPANQRPAPPTSPIAPPPISSPAVTTVIKSLTPTLVKPPPLITPPVLSIPAVKPLNPILKVASAPILVSPPVSTSTPPSPSISSPRTSNRSCTTPLQPIPPQLPPASPQSTVPLRSLSSQPLSTSSPLIPSTSPTLLPAAAVPPSPGRPTPPTNVPSPTATKSPPVLSQASTPLRGRVSNALSSSSPSLNVTRLASSSPLSVKGSTDDTGSKPPLPPPRRPLPSAPIHSRENSTTGSTTTTGGASPSKFGTPPGHTPPFRTSSESNLANTGKDDDKKRLEDLAVPEIAIAELETLSSSVSSFYSGTNSQRTAQQDSIEKGSNAASALHELASVIDHNQCFKISETLRENFLKAAAVYRTFNAKYYPALHIPPSELTAALTQAEKQVQSNKLLWDTVQVSRDNCDAATQKFSAAQKRTKNVDLIKLAEAQQERDSLFSLCKKNTDEATALGTKIYTQCLLSSMLSVCDNFIDMKTSIDNCMGFLEELQSDIQAWKRFATEELKAINSQQKSELETRLEKCDPIVQRLVNKETEFLTTLNTLSHVFLAGILKDGSLFGEITKEQVGCIFYNIQPLLEFHTTLHKSLSTSLDPQSIFAETMQPLCDLYSKYIANYTHAQHALIVCKEKSPAFLKLLKMCEAEVGKIDLSTLLASPLQRLKEYLQFFEGVIASGEPNTSLHVTEALRELCELAEEAKLDHQTALVSCGITGWRDCFPVPPGRQFITQGTFNSREHGLIRILLFSDILVLAKCKSKTLQPQFLAAMGLHTFGIKEVPDISPTMKFCVQIADPHMIVSFSAENDSIRKEWIEHTNNAISRVMQRKVFHVELRELLATGREQGRDVPSLVESAVAFLENSVDSEGLFRISGNATQIEELVTKIEETDSAFEFPESSDPNVVAGVLKRFLRNLPVPLIPFASQSEFLKCAEERDYARRAVMLRDNINRLSPEHRNTLQCIVKLFSQLAAHEAHSKMSSRNISIVFAPHFLRSKAAEDFTNLSSGPFDVVTSMIDDYETIFGEIEASRVAKKEAVRTTSSYSITKIKAPDSSDLHETFGGVQGLEESGGLTLSLAEIVKQGNLTMKSTYNWPTRWLALKKNYLYSFKTPKDKTPKKVISLQGAELHAEAKREFGFSITTSTGTTYSFTAKNEEDFNAWFSAITSCCSP